MGKTYALSPGEASFYRAALTTAIVGNVAVVALIAVAIWRRRA